MYTGDASGLAATRSTFTDPENHVILPEIISKEPLGPATRQGDDQWSDIVTWVLNATITAEEKGVSSANVDDMRANAPRAPCSKMLHSNKRYAERVMPRFDASSALASDASGV